MENWIIFLVIGIGVFSYKGFNDPGFFEKYVFHTDRILIGKQYYRVVSSAFLHGSWMHLAFNMLALYSFGGPLIDAFGSAHFIFLFVSSLLGGSLLSLFIHRNHGNYRAVGASGAVSGVIFAIVMHKPYGEILVFLFPMSNWLFAILFVGYSIFGMTKDMDNIGHEAHLGGAITGLLVTAILWPWTIEAHTFLYYGLLIPSTLFLVYIWKKPSFLITKGKSLTNNYKKKKTQMSKEEELNALLDKSNFKGKLSDEDKEKLKNMFD